MSSYEGDVGEEATDDGGESESVDFGESDLIMALDTPAPVADSRVVFAFIGNEPE